MTEFPTGSGEWYFLYHNQKLRQDRHLTVGARNIAMDRLYMNRTDGALLPVTSTPRWMRPFKYLDPYDQTPAFTMASCSPGIDTGPASDSPTPGAQRLQLRGIRHGAYVHVRAVDFGSQGAAGVVFRVPLFVFAPPPFRDPCHPLRRG